ncbi:hypothetical protein Dsin_018562 [Dipteronia sinensis]|uniref:Retrotransposon Copia-like N-terminal domain-containing protein n=1 Tax=Dipteronia sinensis TaxID=43782 RepID=A0AAE0A5Q7_9ROSI|nr:hypothetical protein Dsin_018562 [Dipteronia sinensis]
MADQTSNNSQNPSVIVLSSSTANNPPTANNPTNVISINAAAQPPLQLSSLNYPSWRAQYNTLLFGYDLLGYLDGTLPCPKQLITVDGSKKPTQLMLSG